MNYIMISCVKTFHVGDLFRFTVSTVKRLTQSKGKSGYKRSTEKISQKINSKNKPWTPGESGMVCT